MYTKFPEIESVFFNEPDKDELVFEIKLQFSQKEETLKFKFGEIYLLENNILIFAGENSEFDNENLRKLGGFLAKFCRGHKLLTIKFTSDLINTFSSEQISSFCEGIFLGNYNFDLFKEEKKKETINIYIPTSDKELIESIKIQQRICSIINYSREIGQLPGNVINPVTLANICLELGKEHPIKVKVLDEKKLEEIGAHAILSVGKGSISKPRMIILEYIPENVSSDKPIVLVGKAITFDTGGYSIKPVDGIKSMKFDKLGGITVLGTMLAAASLKINKKVVGIICTAENMISEDAYRPDDIIKTLSGKTVEILSTDAEGRLVLADGITYAQQNYQPACIIDFATLTGGIVIALGKIRAGLFSNNEELSHQLFNSGEVTNEKLWKMPLDDEYFEFIKGDDADLKNAVGREGHPIMGAIFLKQFIENDVPWAHIDIAGSATNAKSEHYLPKGAKGFGIRMMIDFLSK